MVMGNKAHINKDGHWNSRALTEVLIPPKLLF